ncbi:MAG: hypothetical protein QXQ94_02500 [Candidatus Bathyarchaeia archaeon]
MHWIWKVLIIIYGFALLTTLPGAIGALYIYPGIFFFTFLTAPMLLPFMLIVYWYIAIPYFAVTLSLLYWWEKRKTGKLKSGNLFSNPQTP